MFELVRLKSLLFTGRPKKIFIRMFAPQKYVLRDKGSRKGQTNRFENTVMLCAEKQGFKKFRNNKWNGHRGACH